MRSRGRVAHFAAEFGEANASALVLEVSHNARFESGEINGRRSSVLTESAK
jgi:hypothetical protein